VQSPQFVDYAALSISTCELVASAALFPPAAHELANSTRTMRAAARGYFTLKHNLIFPELELEREFFEVMLTRNAALEASIQTQKSWTP